MPSRFLVMPEIRPGQRSPHRGQNGSAGACSCAAVLGAVEHALCELGKTGLLPAPTQSHRAAAPTLTLRSSKNEYADNGVSDWQGPLNL